LKRCYGEGAVNRKQKELMAVATAVATRCVPCLANHGGGPSFVIVRDHLLGFLDEMAPKKA